MEEEKYNLSRFYEKKINIFRKDKILSTNAQHKRCKLSFIGSKMRMIAPYILRDFSEGGTSCHTQHSWQRLATSHEEQMKQIILVLF